LALTDIYTIIEAVSSIQAPFIKYFSITDPCCVISPNYAEVAELDAREKFYKRQPEILETTNTLLKNPKLKEYLHSISTIVRDLGPEGMRKMIDASFVYT